MCTLLTLHTPSYHTSSYTCPHQISLHSYPLSPWAVLSLSPSLLNPYRNNSVIFMSPSGRTTQTFSEPPSNFQLITDALCDYLNQTGVDLSQNSFAERLQLSNTPNSILELLQERENAFVKYREGNRFNRTLIKCLSPAVRVLHTFSETLREAVSCTSTVPSPIPIRMSLLNLASCPSLQPKLYLSELIFSSL